jgi:hypothetical protein
MHNSILEEFKKISAEFAFIETFYRKFRILIKFPSGKIPHFVPYCLCLLLSDVFEAAVNLQVLHGLSV